VHGVVVDRWLIDLAYEQAQASGSNNVRIVHPEMDVSSINPRMSWRGQRRQASSRRQQPCRAGETSSRRQQRHLKPLNPRGGSKLWISGDLPTARTKPVM
jgi:hypothetical protein